MLVKRNQIVTENWENVKPVFDIKAFTYLHDNRFQI